jgi:mannose-1-phosphate guanylyltransferase
MSRVLRHLVPGQRGPDRNLGVQGFFTARAPCCLVDAVILAGGLGTRMRPLTFHRPKPLLPLLGEPMIDRLVRSLPGEVDRVTLAVNYMADAIRDHLEGADLGREVVVVKEAEPLGTGGAFRNALGDSLGDDFFFGLNGDVVASLDLDNMLHAHHAHGGAGTISVWRVEDPSAYGVVEMRPGGRITGFQEKPPRGKARSDLINAGTYVLRADILDSVERGRPCSLEREVFPHVLDRGLFGHAFEGFWVDAGTPADYLRANRELLASAPPRPVRPTDAHPTARIVRPSLVMEGARLGTGCEVGPFAVVGAGCVLGEGARVSESVLLPRVRLGARATVARSVLGEGAEVAAGAVVEDAVVEDRAHA